jgi:hypothetical protein
MGVVDFNGDLLQDVACLHLVLVELLLRKLAPLVQCLWVW